MSVLGCSALTLVVQPTPGFCRPTLRDKTPTVARRRHRVVWYMHFNVRFDLIIQRLLLVATSSAPTVTTFAPQCVMHVFRWS